MEVLSVAEALPRMQALASRLWSPTARQHPGQLAWSVAYAEPAALDHGPAALVVDGGRDVAWAWQEAPGWVELCVDPEAAPAARKLVAWAVAGDEEVGVSVLETERHVLEPLTRAGFAEDREAPWLTHHHLDLALLEEPVVPEGYRLRPVEPGEAAARAACHRAAWSPTSKVTTAAYDRLMATSPYRHALDWVAMDAQDTMVASCLVWLDPGSASALVEPVGCHPDHRGRRLAGAVSLAALRAARGHGAETGLVCPRGDDGYPIPGRVYRRIGFLPGHRTLTLRKAPRA